MSYLFSLIITPVSCQFGYYIYRINLVSFFEVLKHVRETLPDFIVNRYLMIGETS